MKKRIIIGVIGKDIHIVANRVMHLALEKSGYDVCNIGVINTAQNFIDAAYEFNAEAIIVSSLNGEALTWCKDFKKYFKNIFFKKKIKKYIGGNLLVGNKKNKNNINKFKIIGFDRVFNQPRNLDILLSSLKKDLK